MWIKFGNQYFNLAFLVRLQFIGVNNYTATFIGNTQFTGITQAQVDEIMQAINPANPIF